MNKLLITTILIVTICSLNFRILSPQDRIDQDLKQLTLKKSKFVTNSNKQKRHREVVLDIKRNFTLTSEILNDSDFIDYSSDDLSVREWRYDKEGRKLLIQEFQSSEKVVKDQYLFYCLVVNDLSEAKEAHYLSEGVFGLISYSINQETTLVKKEDRRGKFRQKKEEFYSKVKNNIQNK